MNTIAEALAARDFDRAALLAAEIPEPGAYRDAMVRIHNARQKGSAMSDTATETDKPLRNSKGDFALEPDVEPGKVPSGVVDELRVLRTKANDASTDFREAIKVQAEKAHIKPSALRKYIVALGNDRVDEARIEAEQLEHLIETSGE